MGRFGKFLLNLLRTWKLPLLGLGGFLFALTMVFGRDQAPKKEPVVAPPISPYDTSIAGIGIIEPRSELLALGTELPGIVRTVYVRVGDRVKAGDLLFALDQRDIDAQITVLQAGLAAARIQAQDTAAQFSSVSDARDSRAVARDEFNKRRYADAYAKARVDEIAAQLNLAKTTKERLSVRAPIAGQILEVNVRPGEYAMAGNTSAPLIRMGDVAVRHVRVEIDEENVGHVHPDASAQGFLRGDDRQPLPLQFVRFEPYAKAKQNLAVAGQRVDTRVVQVIYALPEATPPLFIGQQLDVFINNKPVANNASTRSGH